jgi:tRNA (adenine22-N1)-methyltransferase
MKTNNLSPRLRAIAALVPHGAKPVDVGTDHGYLPAWLLQNGVCSFCTATDINAQPLESARRTLSEAGVSDRAELLLCDGLADCDSEKIDTVVIAGMGGDNIAGILSRAPWAREGRLLLLQPMSKAERLRAWLCEAGYEIMGERLVRDAGKLYAVISAVGGRAHKLTEAEMLTGEYALVCREELFGEMISEKIEKFTRAVEGQQHAETPSPQLDENRRILRQLIKMKETYENDKG